MVAMKERPSTAGENIHMDENTNTHRSQQHDTTPPLGLAMHRPGVLEWKRHSTLEDVRSKTDFEVLDTLGEGGFGVAYRVRNKVDSNLYAMKKVLIPSSYSTDQVQRVLREAQVLSSLESTHIVRYYSAWLEKGRPTEEESDDGIISSSSFSFSVSDNQSQSRRQECFGDDSYPQCSLCQSSYKDWEVSFEHWGLIDAVLQPLDLCVPCYLKSLPDHVDKSKIRVRDQVPLSNYLFILMELCESTLTDVMKEHQKDDNILWSLFRQCVEGVAYLHSRQVWHRDLKPSNIFVHQGVVKIGDLGLATATTTIMNQLDNLEVENESSISESGSRRHSRRSSHIGTFLYTAPEVETGSYDERCDIFSLGILLVEMFSNFTTGMERIQVLQRLKRQPSSTDDPLLPQEWIDRYPLQTELAKAMTDMNPKNRWSCTQILAWMVKNSLWDRSTSSPATSSPREMMNDGDRTTSMEALVTALSSQNEQLLSSVSQLRDLLDHHGISHSHIS